MKKIIVIFSFLLLIGFFSKGFVYAGSAACVCPNAGSHYNLGGCGGGAGWTCQSSQKVDCTFVTDESKLNCCGGTNCNCVYDSECITLTNPQNNNQANPPQTPNPPATANTTATTAVDTTTITKLAPTEGAEDLCLSLVASKNIVNTGETFTLTATSKNNTDIQTFDFLFFNKDTGKPVKFTAGEYKKNITLTVFKNTYTTDAINFTDFLFPDLNWPNYYANWPKNIIVEAYLHQSATKWSKFDPACRVELKINSVQPTPTPNPNCLCTSGSCTAAPTCLFDKYNTGFTYGSPIKCNLDNSLFFSTPTDTNKTGWCQSYLRQKGDANGDGKVDALDYFYFVSVKSASAKIPATVNVDFNGDGNITNEGDRAIIVKSLK